MDFVDTMKEYLDKSVKVSKEAIDKAGDAVQDFSDKSIIRIEIKQLESKNEHSFHDLGIAVYKLLSSFSDISINSSTPEIADILSKIKETENDINKRKKILGTSSKIDSKYVSKNKK